MNHTPEYILNTELGSTERGALIHKALADSIEIADANKEAEDKALQIMSAKRDEVAERFGAIIIKAKDGDRQALGKLRHMNVTSDPALGMRLALMNRKQRLAFASDVRHVKGDKARAKAKAEARRAKKARRR